MDHNKNYEKIELPINAVDAAPSRPDVKWAGVMIGVVAGFFAFTFIVFHLFSNFVVANISLEQEQKIFGNMFHEEFGSEKLENYYTFSKDIPEFKQYNIYVSDEDMVNAFAFLGGNIVVTKALIDSVEYEEELIFVVAHEIGHIMSRHNLKALARDLPFKMTLFFIGFDISLGFTNVSSAATNAFSRSAERNADQTAINIMSKYKINPFCASKFFDHLGDAPIEFMSTHPAHESRVEQIKQAYTGKTDFSDCTKMKVEEI